MDKLRLTPTDGPSYPKLVLKWYCRCFIPLQPMLQLLLYFRFDIRRTRNIEQRRRRLKRVAPRAATRRRRELLSPCCSLSPSQAPPCAAPPRASSSVLLPVAVVSSSVLLLITIASSFPCCSPLPSKTPWTSCSCRSPSGLVGAARAWGASAPWCWGDGADVGVAAAGGVGWRMELPLERVRSKSIHIVLFITEKGNGCFLPLEIALCALTCSFRERGSSNTLPSNIRSLM
jgi:hypothetical protein